MGKTGKGYLFAILSAIIFGSMPLMAKHIYAEGVTPMTLVFLRNFIALLPLGILAYKEQKTLKIPVKKLPAISLISVLGCSITPIMLFTAYQFIDSSTATVFHFIYPAAVVLAEILFMKKKAHLHNIVSVLLCVLGIILFYSPQQTLNLAGSVLALASGLTFAAYVVLLARFDKTSVSGFLFSFYVAAVSSVFSFVVCLCAGMLALPTSLLGWGLCILFSILVTTVAVVLFQRSTFLIGSERTSILSTLEPITSVVIGVVVFSEPLGLRDLIGSALVVLASVLIAVFDFKKSAKEKT